MDDKTKDVKEILSARGKTHGMFDNNANVIQAMKDAVRSGNNWKNLNPMERESIEMIIVKISRAACGTSIKDHFDDIAGYALLGAESAGFKTGGHLPKCICADCRMG